MYTKAGTTLILHRCSTYYAVKINGKLLVYLLWYIVKQSWTSPLCALDHSRYIIGEKHMSAECAEASN
jgi:hypothetical protein